MSVGLVFLLAATAASAQTSSKPANPPRGYVEANIQSAFGNVTSQSFGGEFGVTITGPLQVWGEFGHTRDVAPAFLGAEAQQVAGAMSQTLSGVTYSVKEPATFGVVGVRYIVPVDARVLPYLVGGVGAGRVENNVRFSINGSDVTPALAQYGVVLGTGLSGNDTKAMFVIGGGVQVPLWQRLAVDVQYRYGRIMTDPGTNVNRAGIGIGVRF